MEDQMEPRRKVKAVVGNFLMVLAAVTSVYCFYAGGEGYWKR